MRSGSSGHLAVGIGSALLGAVSLGLGVLGPAWLSGRFLGTPYWALFVTGGFVLMLAGGCVVVFSVRREEEPAPAVPAHVAFNSRMSVSDASPLNTPRPAGAAAGARSWPGAASSSGPAASGARLPTPAASQQQRVAPPHDDITNIDLQIRDLTRRINKAGVMLATGQLSQGGYLVYVDDLKRQRGALEAQRVRHELRS